MTIYVSIAENSFMPNIGKDVYKRQDDTDQIIINQKCIRNHIIDLSLARNHRPKVINDKWLRFGDVLKMCIRDSPEHFAGASVCGGDGSSRKADIGCLLYTSRCV